MASLKGKRAQATVDGYDDILRLYVRPVLGHLRLEDLKLGHVEDDLVADMQASGKSPRTMRLAVTALGAACKWGVRRGRLTRNPCEGVQLPKDRGTRKRGSLTQEQVKALRQAAADSPMAALFDFLLFTGVRPGEAFALRWKDLDLRKNTAHIAQTISRHKGGWEFLPPKAGSERKVPLPQTLVKTLRVHRKAQAEHRLQLGEYYNAEHDLVFANDVGEPLDERNVSQRWLKPAVEAAGLPKEVSLYWLRHSHATNLLAAGVPVKDVSHRLGHNSAKMTLDVYAHALPGHDEHVAEVVEGLFGD
jgi:integrase